MPKKRHDHSKTACCGADIVKIAGLRRCKSCRRLVNDGLPEYGFYSPHDRAPPSEGVGYGSRRLPTSTGEEQDDG